MSSTSTTTTRLHRSPTRLTSSHLRAVVPRTRSRTRPGDPADRHHRAAAALIARGIETDKQSLGGDEVLTNFAPHVDPPPALTVNTPSV